MTAGSCHSHANSRTLVRVETVTQHVSTGSRVHHGDLLRLCARVGASWTQVLYSRDSDPGFDSDAERASLGRHFPDRRHPSGTASGNSFVHVRGDYSAVRSIAGLHWSEKIGASRSAALQSISPLISAVL